MGTPSLSFYREVAQLVAYLVWDQGVAGSSPVFPTEFLDSSAVEPSTVNRVVVGSNPSRGANCQSGGMVYTLVLGTSASRLVGSSPTFGTK